MQKINKVFLSLIIICLVSLLIPFNISADDNVLVIDDNDIYYLNNTENYYLQRYELSNEIRAFAQTYGSAKYVYFVVKNTALQKVKIYVRNGFSTPLINNNCNVETTDTYYYLKYSTNTTWVDNFIATYGTCEKVSGTDGYNAWYYTFGDGYVDPTNYGELIVGFHTNFSASGTTNNYTITSNTNLDTIEWENIDSNGNDLQNKGINVQIRAVPILYSANSKSALDLLGFQDAVVNYNDGLILWTGNFNDNHKSFIWNDVINQLQTSNPAFVITSLLTGSVWTRYGWIYQIRYNDVLNSYSSEWQTIYNSTSIKVSDSEKIVNQYYYHYPSGVGSDDQQIFQDINTVNNTTNTWYVNEVPVDPNSSWLDSLIQAIAEIIGKILDFFSSIFDGLVDLILGLFGDINPADSFFNWFSNLFNGIGDIDLTLPEFNLPNADLTSFNRLVQETLNIFGFNNFGFVIFIPLLLIIIKAVF